MVLLKRAAALTVAAAFGLSLGCGETPSTLRTIDLPQTMAKSQGGVGFCWAYGTIALAESTSLATFSETHDLSEEALGFYRIAEELSYLSRAYSSEELSTPSLVNAAGFEGITGSDFLFHADQKAYGRFPPALALLKKYGAVPESAWSVKFGKLDSGEAEGALAIDRIIERFVDFKAAHPESSCCDVETLVANVMLAPEGEVGFPTPPPSVFEYEGRTQAGLELLRDRFRVKDVDDYEVVTASSLADFDRFVQRTKVALAAGEPVPLEFSVDFNYVDLARNVFTGVFRAAMPGESDLDPAERRFNLQGGHVVLITDFVNVGGRPGLVSEDEKAAALAADPEQLDYFVVKNSWGQGGDAPAGIAAGSYLIKKKYLRLHMAAHARDQISTLFVAVPR